MRSHLEEILDLDVKLFWDNNFSQEGKIEVLIRGAKAKVAEKFIQELNTKSIKSSQIEDKVIEIELKVEKIYLWSILNFYKSTNIHVNVEYDKTFELDEIYQINQLTSLFIIGREKDVMNLAEIILDHVDKLVIFTLIVSSTEARILEQNLGILKPMIFPVGLRLSKEKIVTESPHPFFFYSREERKLQFIGMEQ